jgi:hypothetical protein
MPQPWLVDLFGLTNEIGRIAVSGTRWLTDDSSGCDRFGTVEMLAQSRQGRDGELFDLRILRVFGGFVVFLDVLAMVFDPVVHHGTIKFSAVHIFIFVQRTSIALLDGDGPRDPIRDGKLLQLSIRLFMVADQLLRVVADLWVLRFADDNFSEADFRGVAFGGFADEFGIVMAHMSCAGGILCFSGERQRHGGGDGCSYENCGDRFHNAVCFCSNLFGHRFAAIEVCS